MSILIHTECAVKTEALYILDCKSMNAFYVTFVSINNRTCRINVLYSIILTFDTVCIMWNVTAQVSIVLLLKHLGNSFLEKNKTEYSSIHADGKSYGL